MPPRLIVNLKTYRGGSGAAALEVARACDAAADSDEIAVAPQAADIHRVSGAVDIPVYAQAVDTDGYGSRTGITHPETVACNGADGTLINHHGRGDVDVTAAVRQARDAGLTTVVCAADADIAATYAAAGPDAVAVEPPALIGGDIAVGDAAGDEVRAAVEAVNVPVLCGAGINDTEDVEDAVALGASGVLVASGVVNADDPAAAVRHLMDGFPR